MTGCSYRQICAATLPLSIASTSQSACIPAPLPSTTSSSSAQAASRKEEEEEEGRNNPLRHPRRRSSLPSHRISIIRRVSLSDIHMPASATTDGHHSHYHHHRRHPHCHHRSLVCLRPLHPVSRHQRRRHLPVPHRPARTHIAHRLTHARTLVRSFARRRD